MSRTFETLIGIQDHAIVPYGRYFAICLVFRCFWFQWLGILFICFYLYRYHTLCVSKKGNVYGCGIKYLTGFADTCYSPRKLSFFSGHKIVGISANQVQNSICVFLYVRHLVAHQKWLYGTLFQAFALWTMNGHKMHVCRTYVCIHVVCVLRVGHSCGGQCAEKCFFSWSVCVFLVFFSVVRMQDSGICEKQGKKAGLSKLLWCYLTLFSDLPNNKTRNTVGSICWCWFSRTVGTVQNLSVSLWKHLVLWISSAKACLVHLSWNHYVWK